MRGLTQAESLVPSAIKVMQCSTEPDWLDSLATLDQWSPFMAACIFCGVRPESFDAVTKTAVFTRDINQGSLDDGASDFELKRQVKELTRVIACNALNQGNEYVTPSEIVLWAIENGIVGAKSEIDNIFERRRFAKHDVGARKNSAVHFAEAGEKIAQHLDQDEEKINHFTRKLDEAEAKIKCLTDELYNHKKRKKGTGNHFSTKREIVLSAALHRLSIDPNSCTDENGRVIASKLANQVNDSRVFYGFGMDDKAPAATSITEYITGALSKRNWGKNTD